MSKKGWLRGEDGLLHPPWDPQMGPIPAGYPQLRRPRASTPTPRESGIAAGGPSASASPPLLAQIPTTGAPRASPRNSRTRGTRSTWFKKWVNGWLRWTKKMCSRSLLVVFIGLLTCGDGTTVAALGLAATESARAVGDVAAASAVLIASGANVSATVIRGGAQAISTTQNAAQELWSGIDVLGLEAESSQIRAVGQTPQALREHWRSPQGKGPWPEEVLAQLERCCSERPVAVESLASSSSISTSQSPIS